MLFLLCVQLKKLNMFKGAVQSLSEFWMETKSQAAESSLNLCTGAKQALYYNHLNSQPSALTLGTTEQSLALSTSVPARVYGRGWDPPESPFLQALGTNWSSPCPAGSIPVLCWCCAGALHEGPEAVGSPCWRSSVPPGCKAGRCVLDGPAEAQGDQKGLQHCAASGIITSRGCSCAYQEALSCSVPTSELFLNLHAWFYLLNVPLESHQHKRACGTPNKV